jgi:hypothetical protein
VLNLLTGDVTTYNVISNQVVSQPDRSFSKRELNLVCYILDSRAIWISTKGVWRYTTGAMGTYTLDNGVIITRSNESFGDHVPKKNATNTTTPPHSLDPTTRNPSFNETKNSLLHDLVAIMTSYLSLQPLSQAAVVPYHGRQDLNQSTHVYLVAPHRVKIWNRNYEGLFHLETTGCRNTHREWLAIGEVQRATPNLGQPTLSTCGGTVIFVSQPAQTYLSQSPPVRKPPCDSSYNYMVASACMMSSVVLLCCGLGIVSSINIKMGM